MVHWWDGEPGERYWLEITRRPDVGEQLWHFTENSAGRPLGQTKLLDDVRPDDVVLHYDANRSAIVGRSRVSSGSARRRRQDGSETLSREVADYRPYPRAVWLESLRAMGDELLRIQEEIEQRHGPPTWLPFAPWRGVLRPQNRYFAKLPAAMIPLIEGAPVLPPADEAGRAFDPRRPPTRGRFGRAENARQRFALQEKAKQAHHQLLVALARELGSAGWREIGETRSIDLWAAPPRGRRVIFEAKTVTEANELSQTRAGLAQLLEYRQLLGTPDDRVCLVVDGRISPARAEVLDALGIPVLALQVRRFVPANPSAADLAPR